MKILEATITNAYRSHKPKGFYHPLRGHTGIDLNYVNQELPSPISGEVVGLVSQQEMGNCLYIKDAWGSIHVFAHLSTYKVKIGQKVIRDMVVAVTGNTGRKTTQAHLHYEVIVPKENIALVRQRGGASLVDYIMTRRLLNFSGLNVDPIKYLKSLYNFYHVQA